jgi:WD40 repeat protein
VRIDDGQTSILFSGPVSRCPARSPVRGPMVDGAIGLDQADNAVVATIRVAHVSGVTAMSAALPDRSVDAAAFAADGASIAAVADGELLILPLGPGEVARALALPAETADKATSVAFSPAGDRVAVAFHGAGLMVVDIASGAVERLRRRERHVSLVWSPDSRHLAAGDIEPWVTIYDVAKRKKLYVLDPDTFDDEGRTDLAFVGDALLSTALNKICLWPFPRIVDGKVRLRVDVGEIGNVPAVKPRKFGRKGFRHVVALAVAPDGAQVAALEEVEGKWTVSRLDVTSGKNVGRALSVPDGLVESIVWTCEPGVVAIAERERGASLWNLDERRRLDRSFEGVEGIELRALASDPRGTLLAGATSAGLWIWDVATGRAATSPRTAAAR